MLFSFLVNKMIGFGDLSSPENMPRQKTQLAKGEIYHIVLRAVGDSKIFVDENDYYRGIFSIYEFNNFNSVTIQARRKIRATFKKLSKADRSRRSIQLREEDARDKLVEILAFAFMPNHIHLLVRQINDKGVSQFMQKFGGGYANYFNKKYNRKGHLLNQFKAIHIKTNEQLKNVFVYIHTNPLSLIEPGWKEKGITDSEKDIKFLSEKYRWSSFFDYIEKNNFASVTSREFLLKIMGGEKGCKEAVEDWIKYKKQIKDFGDIVLE
jgi:REP element-mobilizing transposase RayT